ncbi:DUF4974 domain-containing protein [Sphingobacterium olei]|uniref:DUF4974 domain-containing protein n=1 Tax=Sphingobacterium olei TaxID=2571155 RepID=A0A4V5MN35_9SPHI|nr:FecR domain-containing protein [Sphingobacterium olei]TJZ63228.1 DUF4974 domain-containing protein [Sphingobacterium olei]
MKKEWITKYILGEETAEERVLVEQWIKQDKDHETEYLDMKKAWELGEKMKVPLEVDVDRAWNDFVGLRDERMPYSKSTVKPKQKITSMGWWKIVAAIVVVCLSSMLIISSFSQEEYFKTRAYTRRSSLPDGSIISMNKRSELSYHSSLFHKTRRVNLVKGEAFFEVKKDTERPFIIETGKTKITVMGTSFHVRRSGQETEVVVATGSVKVNYANQELVLTPKQTLIIQDTLQGKAKVDTVPDQLYKYYVHQEFIFENTPLSRVLDIFSRAYGQQFILDNPDHGKLLLTTTFREQKMSEMISVIGQTFNLTIEKRGNAYHIK